MRFIGRRALVTGGARGIGRAAAARLQSEGARVAVIDIDGSGPEGTLGLIADVADERALETACAAAVDAFGGLDVVIANAAVQLVGRDDRADRLELEPWRRTVDVNLTGAFLTLKHGARALLRAGGGAIVCVGSPAGQYGIAPGLDAYSASKAGVFGLVRVAAIDYAEAGIRVNGVFPGITETPMNHWWMDDPEARASTAASIPLGRPAQPDEIASVIAFLASDEASYVTGALRDRVVSERVVVGVDPAVVPPAPAAGSSQQAAPPRQNVQLARGRFTSGEHATHGTATIVRLRDGRRFLTLTSFSTSPGPDVRVRLAPARTLDGGAADAVDLGALKGNRGDQQYRLPSGARLRGRAVVIWCRAFSARFGSAVLTSR